MSIRSTQRPVHRGYLRLVPAPAARLTAATLLASLGGLSGVRRIAVRTPLADAVLVAGIEIATLPSADDRGMRAAWRQRQGGGALPLLLLADDSGRPGQLVALGPLDVVGPTVTVEGTALFAVLQRLIPLTRLEAVRDLADELKRLDQAGVPGLRLRDLLTLHTLDVRLRRDATRWSAAEAATTSIAPGADWQGVLRGLGYTLERRRLYGWIASIGGRRVAVVHPKGSPAELSRLDADGRPPEGRLLNDCAEEGVDYGILTSGSRLRLLDARRGAEGASSRYIDLDAALLRSEDRPFLSLLGPAALSDGQLPALQDEARAFGTALRRRLDDTIRQTVLPALGGALGRWARAANQDVGDEAVREELERAALTLVFRALFLMYAESSGYLPMDNRAYQQASLSGLVDEAHATRDKLGPRSTALWDRVTLLVKALRSGNPAWGVPAYNGDLFARDGFDGATTLERAEIADPDMATVLIGLGRDAETGGGIDYSTLEIGNLGHIYEGLLSLRLSVAEVPLRYDRTDDRYVAAEPGDVTDVFPGDLLWQTHEGGRKGGGVYYTRAELVSHLVAQTVRPAYAAHLERVRATAETDPGAAASELFDFAVLDPACGSAHFLVVVVNELADQVVRFLAQTPLPVIRAHLDRLHSGVTPGVAVDDVALLRRLVLKHCVFGVDISSMGAEVAKLSLWLCSFVPGLSLAYLGRNVVVGNSLVGVAQPDDIKSGFAGRRARRGKLPVVAQEVTWLEAALERGLADAARAVAVVAGSDDRTPEEVEQSEAADADAHNATARLECLFDLWTSEPFGVTGARGDVEVNGADILRGAENGKLSAARAVREEHRFLHWPLAFPRVFSGDRPGFDAVVGNPPWNEVTIERLAFFALFSPGLRALSESAREDAIGALLASRPDLADRLAVEQARVATEKAYLYSGEYPQMAGDPDVYKYFCQRYQTVIRAGGRMGVVLPRTAFVTRGSAAFRHWLFEEMICHRVDFLLNSRRWIFDTHPQYTIALVAAERALPSPGHTVEAAGTANSIEAWKLQASVPGLQLKAEAFGPDWSPALLRDQREADVLAKVRHGERFSYGAARRWRCFPLREFHETDDKELWRDVTTGIPLWKGESFDQYDPHGAEERWCPDTVETRERAVNRPRAGAESMLATDVPSDARRAAVRSAAGKARLAFRDVARATDSRTVRACLIPPGTLLSNTAPYLAFTSGDERCAAACLGIMNSLPFDWQARRFAEIHLSYFILEGLIVPNLDDDDFDAIMSASARLSCPDERFADFATATGVTCSPLDEEERIALRAEIDARVARAWKLTPADLTTVLADFTTDAVPPEYRERVVARFEVLS
jgi:hypothetical protein